MWDMVWIILQVGLFLALFTAIKYLAFPFLRDIFSILSSSKWGQPAKAWLERIFLYALYAFDQSEFFLQNILTETA